MVDNSNMPHPKCLGSQKNPGTEPKTCEKGPKLGFEYLPTSKTLHCVRTACMAFPKKYQAPKFLQLPTQKTLHDCTVTQIFSIMEYTHLLNADIVSCLGAALGFGWGGGGRGQASDRLLPANPRTAPSH